MKVLVTGALGFIGKNLVTALNNIKDKSEREILINKLLGINNDEIINKAKCNNSDIFITIKKLYYEQNTCPNNFSITIFIRFCHHRKNRNYPEAFDLGFQGRCTVLPQDPQNPCSYNKKLFPCHRYALIDFSYKAQVSFFQISYRKRPPITFDRQEFFSFPIFP